MPKKVLISNVDFKKILKDAKKREKKMKEIQTLKDKFYICKENVYYGHSYEDVKFQKKYIWFNADGCASIDRSNKYCTFNQMRRNVAFWRFDVKSEHKFNEIYHNMRWEMKQKNAELRKYICNKFNKKHTLSELVRKYVTNAVWNSFPNSIKNERIIDGRFITCCGNDQWLLLESDDYFYIVRASVS